MILFKACTRCGGDVDVTYPEEAYCIQCSHRPVSDDLAPDVLEELAGLDVELAREPDNPSSADIAERPDVNGTGRSGNNGESECPRCSSAKVLRLDRLREMDNYCYRCRPCGHIYSPTSTDQGGGAG